MIFFCSRRGEGFGFLKKVAYMENAVNCGDIGIYLSMGYRYIFVDGGGCVRVEFTLDFLQPTPAAVMDINARGICSYSANIARRTYVRRQLHPPHPPHYKHY